jgi:hypothetical protein
MPRIARNPKVRYCIHKSLSPFQRIRPSQRPCVMFRTIVRFYAEDFLASRPTSKLEDRPLSAVRNLRTRHAVVTGTHLKRTYRVLSNLNLSDVNTQMWIIVVFLIVDATVRSKLPVHPCTHAHTQSNSVITSCRGLNILCRYKRALF